MTIQVETPVYCANHPGVETTLRCSRCEKPICAKCAVLTPTGYRCKDCVRGQQKAFETAEWYDYPAAIIVAGVLSFAGSLIVPHLGFFTLFVAPIAGVVIAEAVRLVVRRHRSRRLFQLASLSAVLASLPYLLIMLAGVLFGGGLYGLLGIVWQALYTITLASSVYYRLRGIQIG